MTYDEAGFLQSTTDTIALTSSFTYAADGFMTSMTTPYGTTRFTTSNLNLNRIVEVTDPLGGQERVEYRAEDLPAYASEPANTVPTVPGAAFVNSFLHYRNTLYWTKRARLLGPGDRATAHIYHWLHKKGNATLTSGVLESEKAPLENRIWYLYPNQASPVFEGDGDNPSVAARALDDGTTQTYHAEFNALVGSGHEADGSGRA